MIEYSSPDLRQMTEPDKRVGGRILRAIGWALIGAIVLPIIVGLFIAPVVAPGIVALISLAALLILTMLSAALARYRRRRAAALLGYVSAAVTLQLPLPGYLRAAARDEVPTVRRRLIRMAALLEDGATVAGALNRVAGELPPLTIDRVSMAESTFTLPETTTRLLAEERRRLAGDPWQISFAYFCVVALAMSLVMLLILTFVFPKYHAVIRDYRAQPPRAMQIVAEPWLQSALLVVVVVCGLMVVRLLAASMRGLFRSRQTLSIFRAILDRLAWYTPVVGRVAEARSATVGFEALALALAAGRTAPEAVAIANLPSLNAVFGERMREWGAQISEGAPLAAAARESRLPRLLTELLASARNDAAGAVAFAARAYGATSERYLLLLRAILPLCFTALFAAGTLLIALALFQPIITVLDAIERGYFK